MPRTLIEQRWLTFTGLPSGHYHSRVLLTKGLDATGGSSVDLRVSTWQGKQTRAWSGMLTSALCKVATTLRLLGRRYLRHELGVRIAVDFRD